MQPCMSACRALYQIASCLALLLVASAQEDDEHAIPSCLKDPRSTVCNPYTPGEVKCVHFEHPHGRSASHDELMSVWSGNLPQKAIAPRLLRSTLQMDDCWADSILEDDRLIADDGYIHILIKDVPCRAHGCCTLPYALRPHSLDMQSLHNFFGLSEYKFLVDMHDLKPRWILDVGGIGMSAVWLSLLYPEAKILRMDPSPDNFAIGLYNSRFFPNITQVNLGLWDKQATLQFCERPGWKTLAYFCREVGDPPCEIPLSGEVDVALLSNVMKAYNIPAFDIIKMDIEGAELQVFREESTKDIMAAATVFVIELHERFVAGSDAAVMGLFKELPFTEFFDDENNIWIRNDFLKKHGCAVKHNAEASA